MTAPAPTRTRRKNRNRRTTARQLRDQIAELRAERLLLARLARPQHPNGGFFSPTAAWSAEALADRVLSGAADCAGSDARPPSGRQ